MLSIRPVHRLSTQTTVSPRMISRSQRWEPTKPAPPVTTTRMPQTSALVGKTPLAPWLRRRHSAY